jgi:hypothetical protein
VSRGEEGLLRRRWSMKEGAKNSDDGEVEVEGGEVTVVDIDMDK